MSAEVVTSENLAEFNAARIPELRSMPYEEVKEEPKEEVKAQEEEHEEVETEQVKEPEPKKKRNGINDRFSELSARARAAQEARDEAEARARAAEAKAKELEERLNPKPKADPDADKPKREEYTDPFDYAEELAKWNVKKELRERDARAAKEKADEEAFKTTKAFQERIAKAKEAIPDFDEVLQSSDLAVSDDVRDAIIESDFGPQILHYLASNPEQAEKINGMNTKQALREIGRLEVRLEPKEMEKGEKEEKPKIKRADLPEPITAVKAKSGNIGDLEDLDYAEYKARRLKEMNKK